MNVYDFDNTIFQGDSTARFFAWSLRHCPRMWLDVLPQAINGILFLLKIRKKQDFKQRMLSFVRFHKNIDASVGKFWDEEFARIKPWYLRQRRSDDIIISASPEFLIKPACDRLGILTVIGSPVDPKTGEFYGSNCHGTEKVRRLQKLLPNVSIDNFYSDSLSDAPLAHLASHAFLVKGSALQEWPPSKAK